MLNVEKSIIKFKGNVKKKGQIGGFNNIASLTGSLKVKECLPCNFTPKKKKKRNEYEIMFRDEQQLL